jgi:ketosteroid isomerase-like protein
MSAADVEVIREMYERFNRGDYEGSTAMLHDDVEMRQWDALPDTDTYVGKEQFLRGLTRWLSGFEPGFLFEPEELTDYGSVVLARMRISGKGRESGVELEQRLFHVWEVKDGKGFRARVFSTEEEARHAAELDAG